MSVGTLDRSSLGFNTSFVLSNRISINAPSTVIWTPERIVSEVRVLTNELDNERVQDINIRNHINVCLSNIAELLNLARDPYFGAVWDAVVDPPIWHSKNAAQINPTLYKIINLNVPVETRIEKIVTLGTIDEGETPSVLSPLFLTTAFSMLWDLKRLSYSYCSKDDDLWKVGMIQMGNCKKLSIEEIMHLYSEKNMQAIEDISWTQHGDKIYLYWHPSFISSQLSTAIGTPNNTDDAWAMEKIWFNLHVFRNPLLDDLMNSSASLTWKRGVDLPDRYIRLLILMVQKMVMEQVNKQIDPNTDAAIQQMTMNITKNIVDEVQFTDSQRKKQEYGLQTR